MSRYAFFRGCMIPTKLPHLEYVARQVLPELGVELVDLDGFTCCPDPVGLGAIDPLTWMAIGARNVSVAEEEGLDILTLCNGCAYTLCHVNHDLRENEGLKEKINDILADTGHEFQGTIEVKHFLKWLAYEVGAEEIARHVKTPLNGLKVATHTGCHLLSPPEVMGFDDPMDPVVFDELVVALGATPVDYDLKTLCCGAALSTTGQMDPASALLRDKLEDIHRAGAHCVTVGCPFCFQQFDMGQLMATRRYNLDFKIPVLYYLQLLGLAMGYGLDEMQYGSHKVKNLSLVDRLPV